MKVKTYEESITEYMMRGNEISGWKARDLFGVMYLPAVIHRIQKKTPVSRRRGVGASGKRFTIYSIPSGAQLELAL